MPGIAEFLAEGPDKLIVAELPDGSVMLTMANTITHERHAITMPRTEAHAAGLTLRFAARSFR
jgi:predicted transcriptional regulator